MSFEKIGKICFGLIRPSLFFLTLLFPLIIACIYLLIQSFELRELEVRFRSSIGKGKTALARKEAQERFLAHYRNADPYFLNKQIESLAFLQKEQTEVRAWSEHPAIWHKGSFEERLNFITSTENRLSFGEQNIRSTKEIKETEEKQQHAVQIDEEDLKKVLSLIEDAEFEGYKPASHSPQLLIQNFHLHRHTTSINTEAFILEMSLLKREFSQ